jgi:hypothetical protein
VPRSPRRRSSGPCTTTWRRPRRRRHRRTRSTCSTGRRSMTRARSPSRSRGVLDARRAGHGRPSPVGNRQRPHDGAGERLPSTGSPHERRNSRVRVAPSSRSPSTNVPPASSRSPTPRKTPPPTPCEPSTSSACARSCPPRPPTAGILEPAGFVLRPEVGAISMSGSSVIVAVDDVAGPPALGQRLQRSATERTRR